MSIAILGFDLCAYRPARRDRPHTHGELQVSLVLRGGLSEAVAGRSVEGGALSVVVKDPGVIHANDYHRDGALIARLSLPATTLAELVEQPARSSGWRWTHEPGVAAPFLRIVARAGRGERRFRADDTDVADLLAAHSARASAPPSGDPPAWLRNTIAHIDEAWCPGLRSSDLARGAQVHPVYLARCVRRWYGVSLGDLLRRARLRAAVRAIAADGASLASVAHGHGFSDEAHLWRAFTRVTGVAPGRYRRLVRAAEPQVAPIQARGRPPQQL